ncbi:MAG: phytanoyl-CoA dioxygenase family protein [Candidatus Latescibacterota bacterium]|nr:phytanoyl-CoA dioxygenase family protein [Candidatus Latescibacterota bacterium]
MQPFLDSSDAIDDSDELARRMDRHGYLFVRGLLPTDVVESLRMQLLTIARDAGWVLPDTEPSDAVADLTGFCVEPEPEYMAKYGRMYELEEFHRVQHRPELTGLLTRMCSDGEILPHPRLIGRTIFPQKEAFTTPPHQDFVPIQGTPETYTAWFPLAALSDDMGGLEVAEGSHRHGVYDFEPALGAGGISIVDSFAGQWRGGTFAQGDVLFFHSMAVHRGVPNKGDRLRMSVDARYQRVKDPVAPGSLLPHTKPQTWEEIYAHWCTDSDLKYYWKQWNLEVVEYDNSYHERRDRMAMKMAERGDPDSRSALQRIVARDADPNKRERAQTLLDTLDTNDG